jgi:hypothetical protein
LCAPSNLLANALHFLFLKDFSPKIPSQFVKLINLYLAAKTESRLLREKIVKHINLNLIIK